MSNSRTMPPGLCQNSRWEVLPSFELEKSELATVKELIQRGRRGFSYPSIKSIAKSTGYSNRSIQRAMEGLVAKMLVRRVRWIRGNGTLGVYYNYLTFAGVIIKASSRQINQNPLDTVAAHNLQNQQIDTLTLKGVVDLEKHIFEMLEPILDLRQIPGLIDGSDLTEWIYFRANLGFSELERFLIDQAGQLRAMHQNGKTKMVDWQHFIHQLEQNASLKCFAFSAGGVHPKLKHRITKYLQKVNINQKSDRPRLSEMPGILSDDEGVILLVHCQSDFLTLAQVNELTKSLASAIDEPVRIKFGERETDPIHPKLRK